MMLWEEHTLAGSILNIFFPPVCPLCEKDVRPTGAPLCGACHGELCSMLIKSPLCNVCGITFVSRASEDHTCGECLLDRPSFIAARSVFAYDGAVMDAIHRFKYSGRVILGPPLGRMFKHMPEGLPSSADLVMPVPLHKKRLRMRGFNQSLLLAKEAARIFSARLDYMNLRRVRHTGQQTDLTAQERKKNVSGAFAVERPEGLNGKKVVLVDDVYTTGATIKECAKTLKKAGAEVWALTLARTIKV